MVLGMILPGLLPAAEILTEEDFVEKVVVDEDFIKLADNFIVLFDASNSSDSDDNLSFFWTSSIDGGLHQEARILTNLSEGEHQITLWI